MSSIPSKPEGNFLQIAYIYALVDPRSREIRYIGKADHPGKRLLSHIRDSIRRHTPVYSWIRSLRDAGLDPKMVVLCATGNWKDSERVEIAKARQRGQRLLNLADGGDQPKASRESLLAAARTMNSKLPRNVQRAYRRLEMAARGSKSNRPHARCAYALERLKLAVARYRAAGTLSDFDRRLGELSWLQQHVSPSDLHA